MASAKSLMTLSGPNAFERASYRKMECHIIRPIGMTDEMVAMAMDNADLRSLEAVARHGSMNRAALELHTVQSNVTARIKLLEEQIGAPLFRRHARGVSLTPAGERVFPFVGRIAKLFEEAEAAARDDGEPQGSLAFGSLETTAALRLSPILSSFAKQYPKVRLTVTTGTTGSLTTDVAEFRFDGDFVAGPVEHHDLCQETVFREELVLVTSPLNPLGPGPCLGRGSQNDRVPRRLLLSPAARSVPGRDGDADREAARLWLNRCHP